MIKNFCAEQGSAPEIEVLSANQIDEAWERVLASCVRICNRHQHNGK